MHTTIFVIVLIATFAVCALLEWRSFRKDLRPRRAGEPPISSKDVAKVERT